MTTTYKDDAPIEEKTLEELRCLRCVLERLLREMNEGLFVDYQMEKFGKKFKGDTHNKSLEEVEK